MNVNIFVKNKFIIPAILLIIIMVSFFFDSGLAIGLGLLVVLSCLTFFIIYKLGFRDKRIYLLFSVVLVLHLGITLFMHYANFQPFSGGGGDYILYQRSAVEAAQCFRQGIFSVGNIVARYPDFFTGHFYPIIIGAVYALTLPEEIIGLMLNVWLVAITIIFVYLIILEIGGAAKNAFIIGLITAVYPSYLFYSGLLLKDPIEICFVILGLLFLIKTVKKFTWYNFLILYVAMFCATHFRFYIGYALIATFVLSWFLFANMNFKKRTIYGIIFIIFLGFIPQISAGQGYCGISTFETYLNSKTVNFYRQIVYNPTSYKNISSTTGMDSSFVAGNGPLGYIKSFMYALLGPFPWQIKNLRQSFALAETMPWYLLLFFIVNGIIICFKKRINGAVPLLIFSTVAIAVMTIFGSNFGIITRIRMPAFISLLCIASLGFNDNNVVYRYIKKGYNYISNKLKIKWLNI